MELRVKRPTMPEVIEFNFEELKREITEKTEVYTGMVYTFEQIKDAKNDVAMLRKFTKALSDERIRVKKDFLKPYEDFEAKIKELTSITDKAIANVDEQIKEYDQKKKDEKRATIEAAFAEAGLAEYITLDKIWDPAWLNTSVSLARIKDCFKDIAYQDERAVKMIDDLPEFSFEAMEYYKESLDLTAALAKATEQDRIAKAKKAAEEEKARTAAEEKAKAAIPIAETKPAAACTWIKFEAYLDKDSAKALRDFFNEHQIAFRAVK